AMRLRGHPATTSKNRCCWASYCSGPCFPYGVPSPCQRDGPLTLRSDVRWRTFSTGIGSWHTVSRICSARWHTDGAAAYRLSFGGIQPFDCIRGRHGSPVETFTSICSLPTLTIVYP